MATSSTLRPESIGETDHKICFCHNQMLSQLLTAIASGSNTLELIKADTCASTGCGGCESEVEDLLARVSALQGE